MPSASRRKNTPLLSILIERPYNAIKDMIPPYGIVMKNIFKDTGSAFFSIRDEKLNLFFCFFIFGTLTNRESINPKKLKAAAEKNNLLYPPSPVMSIAIRGPMAIAIVIDNPKIPIPSPLLF